MRSYQSLINRPNSAPLGWRESCTHSESTLHQLSPYIGKLKSSIARDLVSEYARKGEIVADVFCGSGTIPLECVQMGRQVFASDVSPYAVTLTKGKLNAPSDLEEANTALDKALEAAQSCRVDLRRVPGWVRNFYHPKTLKETLGLLMVLRKRKDYFLLACLLGVLHHQRPGFLSFPSSHLVPYLRSKKFPQEDYPEMYEYRSVGPRIHAKVARALKRHEKIDTNLVVGVRRSTIELLNLPCTVNCFITSPPYMNALDYGRDNRLRNWFLSGNTQDHIDSRLASDTDFRRMMSSYAKVLTTTLAKNGRCVFVVGERANRNGSRSPSEVLAEVIDEFAPNLKIKEIISDQIPDIRRSRRNSAGVKKEHILVYERHC